MAEAYRYNNEELANLLMTSETYCTKNYGQLYMKGDKRPKLTELYEYLFNEPFPQEHRAMSDVIATMRCYRKLNGL
jgi:hypothetical protein